MPYSQSQPKMADPNPPHKQQSPSHPTTTININQQQHNDDDVSIPDDAVSPFYDLELPLQGEESTFNLEKAVCSHGLFMMAPNKWDPLTKSLLRPLRLSNGVTSAIARISQLPHALLVRVYGTRRPSPADLEAVEAQVRRMVRLSEEEERKVREFHEKHTEAKERGFGRVFRSPTLFEDMVKCILLCNCQWPRTLSMAQGLCDLQLELQCNSPGVSVNAADDTESKVVAYETTNFTPATPAVKESKRKHKKQRVATVLSGDNAHPVGESKVDFNPTIDTSQMANGIQLTENSIITIMSSNKHENIDGPSTPYRTPNGVSETYSERRVQQSIHIMGNFPSPEEIAGLDEKYLAKRCGLGYRAGRILKLALGVVEGKIQLSELEELCSEASLSNCNKVDEKLKEINGFGPFTRGNVLMCMGFYNVVPTDSETIRHLKQVHARTTTIRTVTEVVEEMYGEYEPFQFLAYWSEIWKFYEDWFGKSSEMPSSDYRLITASNMRTNKRKHVLNK